jgi:hypothetical protein
MTVSETALSRNGTPKTRSAIKEGELVDPENSFVIQTQPIEVSQGEKDTTPEPKAAKEITQDSTGQAKTIDIIKAETWYHRRDKSVGQCLDSCIQIIQIGYIRRWYAVKKDTLPFPLIRSTVISILRSVTTTWIPYVSSTEIEKLKVREG